MRKYNLAEPVVWRDVLKVLEWALQIRVHDARTLVSFVHRDRVHNYPEQLNGDLRSALSACDLVFDRYRLLCSVRRFLGYTVKSPLKLGLKEFMVFYLAEKKVPLAGDLADFQQGEPEEQS